MNDLAVRIKKLKEKFGLYYKPQGAYRRLLLKQENIHKKELYDYFLALEVRIDRLRKAEEIAASSDDNIEKLYKAANLLRVEMRGVQQAVVKHEWNNKLKELFSESYDIVASVVEGMEDVALVYLENYSGSLSEDAKLIKRRTHWQKKHRKNISKSNAAKRVWRKNRNKYKRAMKKFHGSSAGKQFHRNLARFQKTRAHKEDITSEFTLNDTLIVCKGISSFLTNLVARVQNERDEKITQDNIAEINENIQVYREVFELFHTLMFELFDAYFSEDMEVVADVLEVVNDYYLLVNEDDINDET
jgi:hypothetical protein